MKRRNSLILLACAAVVLVLFISKLSINLFHEAHELHRPNDQTRKIGGMRINSWMTPEDVAARNHISVKQIFQTLDIKPAAGDEKLPLRKLQDKYHISNEDLQDALHHLFDPHKGGDFDFDK